MPNWKKVITSGSSAALTSVTATAGFTGSLSGSALTATTASFALTASNITPVISNDADTRILTANGNGTLNAEGNLTFDGNTLKLLYQSGDEGGEMLLSKPVTNTTIAGTGVTVDIYQNKLRFFEQGGSARGFYLDITTGGAGVGTNLASGGGTVTSVGTSGTVNGITLTGGPITGAGTITLGGTLSNVQSSQLATSSLMIGSTNIALGATASTLAGLTSVTATNFTGTASYATQATNAYTASYVQNAVSASYVLNAVSSSYALSASYARTASYASNLIISGSINNVDYIDFNTGSAVPAWKSGRVFWDNTEQSLAVYNSEADITLNVGQENWTRVWNASGGTISNGKPVRISGTHGDVPQVVLAQAIAVSGSANLVNQILGVATHDIEVNTFGFITTQGLVHGLNTSAYNDGDTLYVSTASGLLVNTQPIAPYEVIPVGQIVKAGPGTSGIIYVAVQQPIDFSDLSSVRRTGVDYAVGDLWTYVVSGSTTVWVHGKQLSGSYGLTGSLNATSFTGSLLGTASYATQALSASFATSTTAVAGTTNYVSKFTSGTTIGNSQIFDNGTNIGIGFATPGAKLHVSGSVSASIFWPSNAGGNYMQGDGSGLVVGGPSYFYSAGSGGSYFEGNVRMRGAISNDTATYLQLTGGTSGITYINGTLGVGTTSTSAKIDTNGSIASNSGLTNASSRPAVSSGTLTNGELRGYSNTSTGADDGFLRVSAGGGTNANTKSYIDLSGYSTVADMDKNIVIGTSGAEVIRIGSSLVKITGSLITSGSTGNGINTSNTTLKAGIYTTVDWGAGELYDDNSIASVNWFTGYSLTAPSFGGVTTVQWGAGYLKSLNTSMSIDWDTRVSYDATSVNSIDWNNRTLYDASSLDSIQWNSRNLLDSSTLDSIDWNGRFLISPGSVKSLDYSQDTFLLSSVYQKDNKTITLQDTVSSVTPASNTYLGDVIEGKVNGASLPTDGQLCYLESDGMWYTYDQTDTNIYGKMVGIVFDVTAGPNTCSVLLEGHVLINDSGSPLPFVESAGYGRPIYIRNGSSTGEMSTSPPSNGIFQILGHCYYQNTSTTTNWMMKFRPSMDWYKL